PELAILMAYSKMQLYQALLSSQLPDEAGVSDCLQDYFPAAIRQRYGKFLAEHPLAREITATVLTNRAVDHAGGTLFNSLVQQHGVTLIDAVRTWLAFDRVLAGDELRRLIYALDNRMPSERQQQLLLRLEDALATLSDWAIDAGLDIRLEAEILAELRDKRIAFEKILGSILPQEEWADCKAFADDCEAHGIAPDAARRLALLPHLRGFLPIVALAEKTGNEIFATARTFLDVRNLLARDEIFQLAQKVPLRDGWDRQALQSLTKSLSHIGFRLTAVVLEKYSGNPEACLAGRRRELEAYRRLRDDLRSTSPANFHALLIAVAALEKLVS
ncbi:MAG: NAD-glutamate dehydrogenase, partial [Desulfuromonadaceae bacterium]